MPVKCDCCGRRAEECRCRGCRNVVNYIEKIIIEQESAIDNMEKSIDSKKYA